MPAAVSNPSVTAGSSFFHVTVYWSGSTTVFPSSTVSCGSFLAPSYRKENSEGSTLGVMALGAMVTETGVVFTSTPV